MVIPATEFGEFRFEFPALFNISGISIWIFLHFLMGRSRREKVRENSNSPNPVVSIPTSYIFCALGFTKVYFQILIKDFERSRLYFSNIGHKRHLVSKCNSPFTLSPSSWSFSSENKNLSAPFSATTTANFL